MSTGITFNPRFGFKYPSSSYLETSCLSGRNPTFLRCRFCFVKPSSRGDARRVFRGQAFLFASFTVVLAPSHFDPLSAPQALAKGIESLDYKSYKEDCQKLVSHQAHSTELWEDFKFLAGKTLLFYRAGIAHSRSSSKAYFRRGCSAWPKHGCNSRASSRAP